MEHELTSDGERSTEHGPRTKDQGLAHDHAARHKVKYAAVDGSSSSVSADEAPVRSLTSLAWDFVAAAMIHEQAATRSAAVPRRRWWLSSVERPWRRLAL